MKNITIFVVFLSALVSFFIIEAKDMEEKAISIRLEMIERKLELLMNRDMTDAARLYKHVKSRIDFNQEKGELYWVKGHQAGNKVGSKKYSVDGFKTTKVRDETYTVAQIAWLLNFGELVSYFTTHDGNANNLRIDNLIPININQVA